MYYFLILLADYKNYRLIKRLKRTIRVFIGVLLSLYIIRPATDVCVRFRTTQFGSGQ